MTASVLSGFLLVAVGALCCHGYGLVAYRLSRAEGGPWATTAVTGLAALIFIGGLLNLARIAFAPLLLGVLAVGVAADLAWWLRINWRRCSTAVRTARLARATLPAGLIAALLAFVAATQFPPAAYNFHDDLEKYFGFVVRMLHTGTLAGGSLSALGSETLGGQAFLQACVAAALPLQYLSGLDALFCFGLCLISAATFGTPQARSLSMALAAIVALTVIDPQVVNCSAHYSGAALVMAAIATTARSDLRAASPWRAHAPLSGLLFAGLISLKPTYALFVALYLAATALAVAAVQRDLRAVWRWVTLHGAWSVAFLAPWIALHAPRLAQWVSLPAAPGATPASPAAPLPLLSFAPLAYGSSFAHYTITGLGAVLLAGWGFLRWRQRSPQGQSVVLAVACGSGAATLAALLLLAVFAPLHGGYTDDLRYALPLLIAVVPLALQGVTARRDAARVGLVARLDLGPVACAAALAWAFAPALADRAERAIVSGHALAFAWLADRRDYQDYVHEQLSAAATRKMRAMQQRIPAGKGIVVWTSAPFQFDFARNPICDVQPAGLAAPWAWAPPVEYVIWQHRGYAVRSPAEYLARLRSPGAYEHRIAVRSHNFLVGLAYAARRARPLHSDGSTVVLKLDAPLSNAWRQLALLPPRP